MTRWRRRQTRRNLCSYTLWSRHRQTRRVVPYPQLPNYVPFFCHPLSSPYTESTAAPKYLTPQSDVSIEPKSTASSYLGPLGSLKRQHRTKATPKQVSTRDPQ